MTTLKIGLIFSLIFGIKIGMSDSLMAEESKYTGTMSITFHDWSPAEKSSTLKYRERRNGDLTVHNMKKRPQPVRGRALYMVNRNSPKSAGNRAKNKPKTARLNSQSR